MNDITVGTEKCTNPPETDVSSVAKPRRARLSCPTPSLRHRFMNTETGETTIVPCNRYKCPVCGPIKATKLRAALTKYFSQFEYIRMWTFTLVNISDMDHLEHYRLLSECFRRLVIELRRNKIFSEKQKRFHYVRVAEPHLSKRSKDGIGANFGNYHFHVMVTEYFVWEQVQPIWEHICQELANRKIHTGQASVVGMPSASQAAWYVVKYVMKGAHTMLKFQKKWTKSGRVSIYLKKNPSREWVLVDLSRDISDLFAPCVSGIYLTSTESRPTSQDFADLSPPTTPYVGLEVRISDSRLFESEILLSAGENEFYSTGR